MDHSPEPISKGKNQDAEQCTVGSHLCQSIFTYADLYKDYFQKDKQETVTSGCLWGLDQVVRGNETSYAFYMLLYYLNFFYHSHAGLLFK